MLLISFVRIYQFYNTFSAINDRIEYNNYDNLKKNGDIRLYDRSRERTETDQHCPQGL